MFRGDVCFSTMFSLPSRTRLLRPSVRKTTFAGTWSDSPSRFAAYAPVGCSRVPALPANALATLSTLGAVTPTMGCCRGTSYSPRATRRTVPAAAIRESALSTASREPRSRKSVGEKTQPFPRALMRANIARSIGLATFIRNLLSEICMRFSDKRQPSFHSTSAFLHNRGGTWLKTSTYLRSPALTSPEPTRASRRVATHPASHAAPLCSARARSGLRTKQSRQCFRWDLARSLRYFLRPLLPFLRNRSISRRQLPTEATLGDRRPGRRIESTHPL